MRRSIAVLLLAGALFFSACGTSASLDLRLFCERFNHVSQGQARLEMEQFDVRPMANGQKYASFLGFGEYVAAKTRDDGRVHTVSLTGLPEGTQADFYDAAGRLLAAFADITGAEADGLLRSVHVGAKPVLGIRKVEMNGFRLSYAANEAGRYFRVSRVRDLPPETEMATLREMIID